MFRGTVTTLVFVSLRCFSKVPLQTAYSAQAPPYSCPRRGAEPQDSLLCQNPGLPVSLGAPACILPHSIQ